MRGALFTGSFCLCSSAGCKGTKRRAATAIMGPAGVGGRRAVLFAGGGDEEDGGGKKGYN